MDPTISNPTLDGKTKSFSATQRTGILAIVCFIGLLSPLSTLMYTPALPAIAGALGVSISKANLTITTYLIFQGITPSIWGCLSDNYGRRIIYIVTLTIITGASVGLCLTNSYTVVLVLRALHATGCSSSRALGVGVIRDITAQRSRGGHMGLYAAGVDVGTAFGPVLGGLLAQYTGWHGIFYFLLGLAAMNLICVLLFLPETLQHSSVKLPKYLEPQITWLCHKHKVDDLECSNTPCPDPSAKPKPKLDFLTPIRMMRYPDVLCALFFTGICFTVWQNSMIATSSIYAFQYGLNEAMIGLTYIANGIGSLLGNVFIGKVLDHDYERQWRLENADKRDYLDEPQEKVLMIEKARMRSLLYNTPIFIVLVLIFGWVVNAHIHISASIIVAFWLGWFNSTIPSTYATLLVDLFEDAACAVGASMNLVACLLGAVGSSTIATMISALGIGWSFTVLAGICLVLTPLVGIQYAFGPKFRQKRELSHKT